MDLLPNTEDEEEEIDFWPQLFAVEGIVNVRPIVSVIPAVKPSAASLAEGTPEGQVETRPHEDVYNEYLAQEEVKNSQIRLYGAALDNLAMELTFDQLKTFIAHYATYHSIKRAAKEAEGSIACFKHRRKIDVVFDEMWTMAREYWTDTLEERGMERATEAVESRFSGPSNDMLKFMLKSQSEKHQDTLNVKHGGIEGAPVKIERTFDVDHLTETVSILHEVLNDGRS